MKFAKKVLVVDAMQWTTTEPSNEMRQFLGHDLYFDNGRANIVCTAGLTQPVSNDWIVRDENGVVSVLHPNIFRDRYSEIVE